MMGDNFLKKKSTIFFGYPVFVNQMSCNKEEFYCKDKIRYTHDCMRNKNVI